MTSSIAIIWTVTSNISMINHTYENTVQEPKFLNENFRDFTDPEESRDWITKHNEAFLDRLSDLNFKVINNFIEHFDDMNDFFVNETISLETIIDYMQKNNYESNPQNIELARQEIANSMIASKQHMDDIFEKIPLQQNITTYVSPRGPIEYSIFDPTDAHQYLDFRLITNFLNSNEENGILFDPNTNLTF